MDAVQPTPYTGTEPWYKWFRHFTEDMDLNGWDETQRLHAMKRALRNGPGEEALAQFDQVGEGTYECLIQLATLVWED